MTRKDYVAAAAMLRVERNVGDLTADEHKQAVRLFTEFFGADNARFDAARFAEAAAPNRVPLTRKGAA